MDFEKLGIFYLGREIGAESGTSGGEAVLYDSRDLVTHAAIVGMTGSGKTGLGVALLEEAALDGVPAIVVDPKGDLANLLLAFPDLAPADFRPYVREEDAARKGLSPDELAAAEAQKWRAGLASSGQDGDRVRRFRDAANVALFTPGGDLGQPVSILASFAAPARAIVEDGDLLRDRVATAATSLLALLGVEADPLQSREHILLASLLGEAWKRGDGYDLAGLIAAIQKPPLAKVGVVDLETFYPAKERFALAMQLNNLLAAPGFDVWLRGEALDAKALLYTPDGKPRLAVISIAHLGDAERMFFVSLLFNEIVGWMRTLSGSSSLRALIFMDEVFGFLPPVAEPPSKRPLLTLLKQGRAFGLGVVLATQNPVDLDYKALSNIGTWILGRLQTERDKARVLDGLEGAASGSGRGFDRAQMDLLLSGLKSRNFLLHNVHEEAPLLFESRWAMSYLAGPLGREQIRSLAGAAAEATAASGTRGRSAAARSATSAPTRPVLPPEIPQLFLPIRSAAKGQVTYRPHLVGSARVHFSDGKLALETTRDELRLVELPETLDPDWTTSARLDVAERDLESEGVDGASFAGVPAAATKSGAVSRWQKGFAEGLYRTARLEILRSPTLGERSEAGESERDFRIRLADRARASRDEAVADARGKFAPKIAALADRVRRAEAKVENEKQQASQRKMETAVSLGATVLGALFGRKRFSTSTLGRATTSAKSASRAMKESKDVALAEESVEALVARRAELEAEAALAVTEIAARFDPATVAVESVVVKPRKIDIEVRSVALAWAPEIDGEPAWS